jgi:comEA protein
MYRTWTVRKRAIYFLTSAFLFFLVGYTVYQWYDQPTADLQFQQVNAELEEVLSKSFPTQVTEVAGTKVSKDEVPKARVVEDEVAEDERDQPVKDASDSGGNKLNINSAGQSEFMSLPGIGEVKAQAIIQYRLDKGRFETVDELDNVKGIGPSTLDKLRSLVTTGN